MISLKILTRLTVILCLVQPCIADEMKFRFKVVSGKEKVCQDVAERLEKKVFVDPPACDRLLWDEGPPFGNIQRIPLSEQDIRKVAPSMYPYLQGDLFGGGEPEENITSLLRYQKEAIDGGWPFRYVFKFHPRIDIDNDGTPDDVVVTKEVNRCGRIKTTDPLVSSSDLLVLNTSGEVDATRTRQLYERANWPPALADGQRFLRTKPRPRPEDGEEAWQDTYGVFEHQGTVYFDSFALLPKSESYRYRNSGGYYGIFRRRGGVTEKVCKISATAVNKSRAASEVRDGPR